MSASVSTAGLVEIFSSIQGEGLFVGCRQVFVRFAGCNISCQYCDTSESFILPSNARIEERAGSRVFKAIPNPVPIGSIVSAIRTLCSSPHHSISLTGGEPLLHPGAIIAIASQMNHLPPIYLETNGTLPTALAEVIDSVDIISMDFKLPSAMQGKSFWREHANFLAVAAKRDVFVKVVISRETTLEELDRATDLIAEVNDKIPLILQPVTPTNGIEAISPSTALLWQERALQKLGNVRVIPQTHKMMGQL